LNLTDAEILELEHLLELEQIDKSKGSLLEFTKYTFDKFIASDFHKMYYEVLQLFADGIIKRLIISVPPQHGKSEGSTRRLIPWLAGKNPNEKIALCCYNATVAEKFGREIKGIMDSEKYRKVFDTKLADKDSGKTNTQSEREIENGEGSLKFVGVGGSLTSYTVDKAILDDLYKDYQDATSPVISERVWEWYLTVLSTRLHNDSQVLIVFTRWDSADVIGRLEDQNKVYELQPNDDIKEVAKTLDRETFLKLNLEAIKTTLPSKLDPREIGEVLFPEKHDKQKLLTIQKLDPSKFDALFQGDPQDKEGLLYSTFKTWKPEELPQIKIIKAYTDTADAGKDYLACIVYGVPVDSRDNRIFVFDIYYTQKGMEITEPGTINIHAKNKVRQSRIESNNGGKGFARVIKKSIGSFCEVTWFHQSKNKIARIFSNSASVNNLIVMPHGWESKYPVFHKHVTTFKKDVAKNKHDDCADALTGVYETEYQQRTNRGYKRA